MLQSEMEAKVAVWAYHGHHNVIQYNARIISSRGLGVVHIL